MAQIDEFELSDLGQKIVTSIGKYRLVTQPLIRQRFDKNEHEVKNEIRRLFQRKLIAGYPFVNNERYYRFTYHACKKLGYPRRLSSAPGIQALKMNYGVLHFCFQPIKPRRILALPQVKTLLYGDDDTPNGQEIKVGQFYIPEDSAYSLSHVFVDCRSAAPRLVKKAFSFVKARRENRAFREMIIRDEFAVSFVTESEGKAKAIQEAAKRRQLPLCEVHVCPHLQYL